MKILKWKWLLIVITAVVVFLAVLIGVMIRRNASFSETPFGYQYSVVSVFFTDREIPSCVPEIPEYALRDDGALLDIRGDDSGRLTGSLRKFSLTEEVFDNIFTDEGSWRVTGLDAVSARKDNLSAWQYRKLDGSFYYVLLQKNGDVFLCIGEDGAICQFYWLQAVGIYGLEERIDG